MSDKHSAPLSAAEKAKFVAARRACDFVEDGMKVGLGTGSTAAWLIRCLAELIRTEGLRLTGVPTSSRTAELARGAGIPVTTLDEARWLDLTIDGADEFDPELNLIKGGGGALLHEKIVATASERMIVIADRSKQVEMLGAFPLPVEVVPFGLVATRSLVEDAVARLDGAADVEAELRMAGDAPFVTDEGNRILDLRLGRIEAPRALSLALNQIAGVVENGLFTDICDTVVIGDADGHVRIRDLGAGTTLDETVDLEGTDNIFADPDR